MKSIAPRKVIFVGCEGYSERSYVAFLQYLADESALHVRLAGEILHGGDPKSCIGRAFPKVEKLRSDSGQNNRGFIFLDDDLAFGQKHQLEGLAAKEGITIVWQSPCHEAMLLRHFAHQETKQPHNSDAALIQLRRFWPSYQKNTSALKIGNTLGLEHVRRASNVTPPLQALIDLIGF